MMLKELKIGEIFTIEETPSYPKLKIDGGYVDIRDDIVNTSGNNDKRDVRIETIKEISEIFNESEADIRTLMDIKNRQYIG